MKFKITKAEFDALTDEQKAQYTAKGDGYQIKIEGMPDFDAMEQKLNKLLDEKKQGDETRRKAEEDAKAEKDKADRLAGNLDAIDKSWGEKLKQAQDAHQADKARYGAKLNELMVGNVAQQLAAKLFGANAGVLEHHVKSRITLEEGENGEFKTRVLGLDGKPSALTTDDLEKEFAGNKTFAPFLVTTKAQGPSGATSKTDVQPIERKQGQQLDNRSIAMQAIDALGNE